MKVCLNPIQTSWPWALKKNLYQGDDTFFLLKNVVVLLTMLFINVKEMKELDLRIACHEFRNLKVTGSLHPTLAAIQNLKWP